VPGRLSPVVFSGDKLELAIVERIRAYTANAVELGPPHRAAVLLDALLETEGWEVALEATSTNTLSLLQSDVMFLTREQWPISGRSSHAQALLNSACTAVLLSFHDDDGNSVMIGEIPLSELLVQD
jgi:hypothetical protein